MEPIKAVILRNELEDDHLPWIDACNEFDQIKYRVVDLTLNNWLEEIHKEKFDILLAKPGGLTAPLKQLFDERIYILSQVLGYKTYPSLDEILIYENKRYFSFWLKANKIPHPKTDVFYYYKEAEDFLKHSKYPIIAKTNIGASGSGVIILKNLENAIKYTKEVFQGRGAKQRTGPNFSKGGIFKRGLFYVKHPSAIAGKLKIYKARAENLQKSFVLFQEFIPHEFEWRVVRIGDSFFAHKKLKTGEKASGSLLKNYDNPPLSIFDFVKEITDKYGFFSQAVDIFEIGKDNYVVNEMQCMFGQSDSYQMLVNGKPGRYIMHKGKWIFEEGDFNRNKSFNLRIQHVIDSINK